MAKIIMNPGDIFGELTFIKETEPKIETNGKFSRMGEFECSCGKVTEKRIGCVSRGDTKSCGCQTGRKGPSVEVKPGDRYHKFTILEELPRRRNTFNASTRWVRAQCDCGNVIELSLVSLRTGNSKSCGCNKLNNSERKGKILYDGKVFGRLTVIREVDGARKAGGSIARVLECKCECGVVKKIRVGDLTSGKTTSCGCYAREKSSEVNSFDIEIGQSRGHLVLLEETEKVTKINPKNGGVLSTIRYVMVKCNSCDHVEEMTLRRFMHESNPDHCGCLITKTTIDKLSSQEIHKEKYHSLKIVKEVESEVYYTDKDGKDYIQRMVECECDCGSVETYRYKDILLHYVKSCGCKSHTSTWDLHGTEEQRRMYQRWKGMMNRCYNERDPGYKHYGARGIEVCERWRESPYNFIEDMGIPESWDLTNDRINPDGNYEPGNCRWADAQTQASNKRTSKWYKEGKENPTVVNG